LELEKAEVQEDLNKNLAKIVEMHKEIEEKSEEVAEKAKQNEALLMQINESTRFFIDGTKFVETCACEFEGQLGDSIFPKVLLLFLVTKKIISRKCGKIVNS
jgi:hypothetical protein